MAIEFHKIWIEQCEAVQGIKDRHGVQKALGYLIGEKLLQYVQTANDHPEFAKELPRFVAEVRRMFHPSLLRDYTRHGHILRFFAAHLWSISALLLGYRPQGACALVAP